MKIVISGFYGAGNLGDESILSSILSSIKNQYPNAEFTILSFNPVETSKLYSVNAIFRPDFGPSLRACLSKLLGLGKKISE